MRPEGQGFQPTPRNAAFDVCQLAPRHQPLKRTDLRDNAGFVLLPRRNEMALKKSLLNRRPHLPRGYVPRLPHHSWRLVPLGFDDSATTRVTSASDFWDRLDL